VYLSTKKIDFDEISARKYLSKPEVDGGVGAAGGI
jgi:hypothetical protein